MNLKKPKFWDKKNSIFALLLFPVTLIALIIIFFKKNLPLLKILIFQLFVLVIFILEEQGKHLPRYSWPMN